MKRDFLAGIRSRLRPWALNATMLLVSFGIAGAVAELAVRVVAPQQLILIRPDLWQAADTVGWLHRPNVSTEINTGERTVTVVTDAAGFRVGGAEPGADSREVLLLGDSFIEALQVEYEESGPGLIQAKLPDLVGEPVAIRNAGIGGWDPDQYLLQARRLVQQHDYELVVTVLYLGNDVIARQRDYLPPRAPVERYRFHFPRGLSGAALTDALLRPLNDFLEVRSHIYLFFRNRLQTLRMEVGLAPLVFPPQFLTVEAAGERWEVTARICAEINSLVTADGAAALFVLVPAPFQVDAADLLRYVEGFDLDPATIDLEQPNRILGEMLSERGLRVLDLLPDFREAQNGGVRLYGSVDPHFSPAGNALFASLVTPVAAQMLSGEDRSEPAATARAH